MFTYHQATTRDLCPPGAQTVRSPRHGGLQRWELTVTESELQDEGVVGPGCSSRLVGGFQIGRRSLPARGLQLPLGDFDRSGGGQGLKRAN